MKTPPLASWLLFTLIAAAPLAADAAVPPLGKIQLPPGFKISLYAENVPSARAMTLGDDGTVYVGSTDAGRVYALPDRDRDGKADEVITVAKDLNLPIGVAFREGSLYVGEIPRILRFDGIGAKLRSPPKPVVLGAKLPTDTHHGGRFIGFGPDGWLYVGLGAPCNVCEKKGPLFSAIGRMRPDGSGLEVFAEGVRNTVGFDWHPVTKELWFTDNGRDWLGDNAPPDELNAAPKPGMNFGFPYCHGGDLPDPEFGKKRKCSEFTAPRMKLGPHVAALGMRFYTGKMFPPEYRGRILIAEHGSWNRSDRIGYRVTQVTFENGQAKSYEPFATGWLDQGKALGRPVDVLNLADGSLLVSDDFAGAIYRISYSKP